MVNKKILIIEDDTIVAGIYRNRLQMDGFVVEVATDGQQGIEKVNGFKPDLVVLDLMLPKVNGVEVIKFIRAQNSLQTLPVIVFSNSYLSTMVQDAWKAGANTCLSKVNSTPKQVLDVIRNTLGAPASSGPTTFTPVAPTIQMSPDAIAVLQKDNSVPIKKTETPEPLGSSSGPAPAPAGAAVPAVDPKADAAFMSDVRKTFLDSAPSLLGHLREMMLTFIKTAETDTSRLNQLFDLYRKVHTVTSNAGVAGFRQISEMTIALEALLKELYENPKNITPSTMRTVAQTIDFLGILFKNANLLDRIKSNPTHILVVDDEVISRRAITFALEKAHLKSLTSENPETALQLINDNHFDLIILDVDMPGMNGFQLCAKLRAIPEYAHTPVIFVTGLTDFESRTKSALSGGSDFIAKPFLFMELAVKALTHVLRNQIAQLK